MEHIRSARDIPDEWVGHFLDDLRNSNAHVYDEDILAYIEIYLDIEKLNIDYKLTNTNDHWEVSLTNRQAKITIKTRGDGNCGLHALHALTRASEFRANVSDYEAPSKFIDNARMQLATFAEQNPEEIKARIFNEISRQSALGTTGFGPRLSKAVITAVQAKIELDTLTIDQIGELENGSLLDKKTLDDYLLYRARKEFYSQLHIVYDLDETLVGHVKGTYSPSERPWENLAGEFTPDKEFPHPIHGISPIETPQGSFMPEFLPIGPSETANGAVEWRVRYRPKNRREIEELDPARDASGELDTETEASAHTVDYALPPSNIRNSPKVKAFSVRPGAIEMLNLHHGYGVRQSTWTHNSGHHSHRVHEILERQGFPEIRFAERHSVATRRVGDGKSLNALCSDGNLPELTLLIDDKRHKNSNNTYVGSLNADEFEPEEGNGLQFVQIQAPAFADPQSNRKKQSTDDLRKFLGERLFFKLARMLAKKESVTAGQYLHRLSVYLNTDLDSLPREFEEFMTGGGESKLQEQYSRFIARQRAEPLIALTPTLGAAALLPQTVEEDAGPGTGEAKNKAKDKHVDPDSQRTLIYKPHNIVNRGLVEVEVLHGVPHVRVYQTVADHMKSNQVQDGKAEFKDVHQDRETGKIQLITGSGLVCFGVGTPLRALKWVEKYAAEHPQRNFVTVVRSFLLPLTVYREFTRNTVVQEQSSHPRYRRDQTTNVDIRGDTGQYEMREGDLDLFRREAVAGSLISWSNRHECLEPETSGEIRPIRELYDRLGMPMLTGIFPLEYNPFVQIKKRKLKHRDHESADKLAKELSGFYATHIEQSEHRELPEYQGNRSLLEARVKKLEDFKSALFASGVEGHESRMDRISEERKHYIKSSKQNGYFVPEIWADDDAGCLDFFFSVLVPAAATQACITAAIGRNVEEARLELALENPGYSRSLAELIGIWEEAKSSAGSDMSFERLESECAPLRLPDTEMRAPIDFARLRDDIAAWSQEVSTRGKKLSESIANCIAEEEPPLTIVKTLIVLFPELSEKFEAVSNQTEQYRFYDHAQMVIGQYIKYFAKRPHPLLSPEAVVKMILFHDMDKRIGRGLFDALRGCKGRDTLWDQACEDLYQQVVRHIPVARGALIEAFGGTDRKASEHILPLLMMEKYGALWDSLEERRLAIAIMNGDPIGELMKSKSQDLALTFGSIVLQARSAGILPSDHAGLSAFFFQLAAFYQADSSSYSSDSSYVPQDSNEQRGQGKGDHGNIYKSMERESGSQSLACDKSGFLVFMNEKRQDNFNSLCAMFEDPGEHLGGIGAKLRSRKKAKKREEIPEEVMLDLMSTVGEDFFAEPD